MTSPLQFSDHQIGRDIPSGIVNFGDVTKQRFKITMKNFGNTPAYDAGSLISDHNVVKKGGPISVVEMECGKPAMHELITLFPNGGFTFIFTGIQHSVPKERLDHVADIDSIDAFVYYGTLCYHDAFGVGHHTNYCWLFSGREMAAENAEGCRQHNDSD